VPYVAAIVDLPEQVAVRCTIVDVRPDPAALPFGIAGEDDHPQGAHRQGRARRHRVLLHARPVASQPAKEQPCATYS
jgi:hypothetical protein